MISSVVRLLGLNAWFECFEAAIENLMDDEAEKE